MLVATMAGTGDDYLFFCFLLRYDLLRIYDSLAFLSLHMSDTTFTASRARAGSSYTPGSEYTREFLRCFWGLHCAAIA